MTYQTTIIAAVVVLIGFMVAVTLGLGVTGRLDSSATPLIVTIFSTITTTVAVLIAILRTDRVAEKVDKVESKAEDIERRVMENGPTSPHP